MVSQKIILLIKKVGLKEWLVIAYLPQTTKITHEGTFKIQIAAAGYVSVCLWTVSLCTRYKIA
ncbi:MAG: hypothetical protein ACJASM_003134 [Salibacteraceae bacterium]|jgi:hypothetical protein